MLGEIGAEAVPRIRVFNKIDHVGAGGDIAAQAEHAATLRAEYPDCLVISARCANDIALLRAAIVAFFQRDVVEAELFLPWSAQQYRGEIYAQCAVLEERADAEGAFFRVSGARETLAALQEKLARAAASGP